MPMKLSASSSPLRLEVPRTPWDFAMPVQGDLVCGATKCAKE